MDSERRKQRRTETIKEGEDEKRHNSPSSQNRKEVVGRDEITDVILRLRGRESIMNMASRERRLTGQGGQG